MPVITTQNMTKSHAIEVCYGSRLHCWTHDADEPEAGAYRACLECGHVFQTPGELLAAWLAELGYPVADAESVPGCPYCSHDW